MINYWELYENIQENEKGKKRGQREDFA